MKKTKFFIPFLVFLVVMFFSLIGCEKKLVTLNLLTYYQGEQLEELEKLTDEFNETIGFENNILVKVSTTAKINTMKDTLIKSASNFGGSEPFPDIFITYKGIYNYIKDKKEIADFSKYFSKEDLKKYNPKLIEAGRFENKDKLSMFPMSYSCDNLFINSTDFENIFNKLNCSYEDLIYFEDMLKLAEKYYNYTDSLTAEKNDGKPLIAISSNVDRIFTLLQSKNEPLIISNNGKEEINFSKENARFMFDYFYCPIIKGYMLKQRKFPSEDLKTGNVLMTIATTSSSIYNPDEIILGNNPPKKIKLKVIEPPKLKGFEPVTMQQGGGIFVTKSTKEKEKAAATFVKWLTNEDNNTKFALKMSCVPSIVEGTDVNYIKESCKEYKINEKVEDAIISSVNITNKQGLFLPPSYEKYEDVRDFIRQIFDDNIYKERNELLETAKEKGNYNQLIEEKTNDEAFETWYKTTKEKLEKII